MNFRYLAVLVLTYGTAFPASVFSYFEEAESGINLSYDEYQGYSSIAVADLDINADGRTDLVFHFFSSLEGLSGDLRGQPTPNFVKIFLQDADGRFADSTEAVLGEGKPSLGGASRHVVKGDFNGDGKSDLAYAINWEDRRLVEDPADLSAQLAAILSSDDKYEIVFFGTQSWYHSLGRGYDQEGREFVTGNGFSGNFTAELWHFDDQNNPIQIDSDGLEVPPNAFEFLTLGSGRGSDLLLRNANFPDMFGIDAYIRDGSTWSLVDQLRKPYESLGTIEFLGWNATESDTVTIIDINGYPSLETGGFSYAESCSVRLSPEEKEITIFKVSSAYIPNWGEVDSIRQDETIALNSLVGFGFEEGRVTKDLLTIDNEEVETNTN